MPKSPKKTVEFINKNAILRKERLIREEKMKKVAMILGLAAAFGMVGCAVKNQPHEYHDCDKGKVVKVFDYLTKKENTPLPPNVFRLARHATEMTSYEGTKGNQEDFRSVDITIADLNEDGVLDGLVVMISKKNDYDFFPEKDVIMFDEGKNGLGSIDIISYIEDTKKNEPSFFDITNLSKEKAAPANELYRQIIDQTLKSIQSEDDIKPGESISDLVEKVKTIEGEEIE